MDKAIMLGTIAALLLVGGEALADDWECSSGGDSACYVTHVRFFPNGTNYVRAELHDPDDTTTCTHVRFQMDSGVTSLEALRGVEAALLTALTTGLPIRFWRLTAYGDDQDCYASTIIVSKPGH